MQLRHIGASFLFAALAAGCNADPGAKGKELPSIPKDPPANTTPSNDTSVKKGDKEAKMMDFRPGESQADKEARMKKEYLEKGTIPPGMNVPKN